MEKVKVSKHANYLQGNLFHKKYFLKIDLCLESFSFSILNVIFFILKELL